MGLINKTVRLEKNYDKCKEMFEEEKNYLNKIFNNSFKIEHVGSTAVKDLLAKPIIDIAIDLNSFEDIKKYENKLKERYTFKENFHNNEMKIL